MEKCSKNVYRLEEVSIATEDEVILEFALDSVGFFPELLSFCESSFRQISRPRRNHDRKTKTYNFRSLGTWLRPSWIHESLSSTSAWTVSQAVHQVRFWRSLKGLRDAATINFFWFLAVVVPVQEKTGKCSLLQGDYNCDLPITRYRRRSKILEF